MVEGRAATTAVSGAQTESAVGMAESAPLRFPEVGRAVGLEEPVGAPVPAPRVVGRVVGPAATAPSTASPVVPAEGRAGVWATADGREEGRAAAREAPKAVEPLAVEASLVRGSPAGSAERVVGWAAGWGWEGMVVEMAVRVASTVW